ncbi:PR domain zinc finger protein 15-like isoform X2 [Paramacrobiotus metropolitanus]|uniref:PR domain zinc finger protein 15-like isoform X2 n=1 Tax=Paramacrobiotus metropolitanus TaxID=2943436 RepID=UPI002445F257|nr:PR domain zinc finger protein 15-like isoform X2 [Paramacrobiotus metropolitanus]
MFVPPRCDPLELICKAVFAKETIPRMTVFGPLIGELSTSKSADVAFACGKPTTKRLHYFQLESDKTSNWMKFVRFAATPEEQNLAAFEVKETSPLLSDPDAISPTRTHVLFVSTKAILPGDELKVAYSLIYCQDIGCPVRLNAQQAGDNVIAASHIGGDDHEDPSSTWKILVRTRTHLRPIIVPRDGSGRPVNTVRLMHNHNEPHSESTENGASLKDKENHSTRASDSTISDARAQKRRKLSIPVRKVLPPDKDSAVNLPGDIAVVNAQEIAAVVTPVVSVEPEANTGVVGSDDAGTDKTGGDMPVLPDGSCRLTPSIEPVEDEGAVNAADAPIEKMNRLKSIAPLQLRKRGICPVCGKRVLNMAYHLGKMHTDKDIQKHPAAMQRTTKTWKHKRPDCGERFSTQRTLEFHTEVQRKSLQCWYCARVFGTFSLLNSHVVDHRVNGKYPCPVCAKSLSTYPLLNIHYLMHHDPTRLMACSICQTACCGKDKLDEHMVTCHNNADPSGETTMTPRSKTVRRGRPPGSKSRVCDVCLKQFNNYQALWLHRRTVHLGKKLKLSPAKVPMQCSQCDKMYASKYTLLTHMRRKHIGDLQEKNRNECTERIAAGLPASPHPRHIRPRLRTAFEDFQYECEECHLRFLWQISLKTHDTIRHPERASASERQTLIP